ncbi:MAG TPA: cell division protein ZapE [Caulobacteraceae bacterium]
MSGLLRAAYDRALAAGTLSPDPAQARAVEYLSRMEAEIAAAPRPGLLRRRRGVRGVYLLGPVGHGKSMLMDLFFDAAPIAPKRRVHFHAFMGEVHALVNLWRMSGAAQRRAKFGESGGDDPIPPVARAIARQGLLLCFDELQVTDIADAMILGRLFEALFALGVSLVCTANRTPGDLYRDGINRALFTPFIAMLETRLEIVPVDGSRDYRLDRLREAGTWFDPIDVKNQLAFDALWAAVLGGRAEEGATLTVLGRTEHWPRAAGGLLRAHFASLCVQALGPADYLAIADRFHTIFLEALPRLGPEKPDAARRLAILVDTLYEARARLVVLAAGEPDSLCPKGDQAFEMQRTVSRLNEMRSKSWLDRKQEEQT